MGDHGNVFDLGDYVAVEVRKLAERIAQLQARVLELEAKAGAAGMVAANINAEAMYSPREAGAFLGWSRVTIYSKVAAGILHAVVLPGSHRQLIAGRDILALIAKLRPAVPA